MMTETRDPLLQSLFDEARQDFEGEVMTTKVMVQTRKRLLTMATAAATASLVVLLISWQLFSMPLLDFALLMSQFFTNPLVDLGEGWLALFLMPINNIASLTVGGAKLTHLAWKKLTGTTLLR